ncbi:hypothetical protein A2J03_22170 [Rhodococcus sp. EPR-157]|uniref:hypothetical protein n=1 Tax=unclassified Rhodococcus (in: high G+C Gram-positive bacteria) TaxID=192944 RepID=UPI0007BC0A68|nr:MULTISPECIES: hypothetical protein [unclassified Rhodococcus (in: high G+C Gram-positive bacteria)]KZF07749.1 hypothetical protein A2J03_22170 [Rhodococcus sp. EPR-157]
MNIISARMRRNRERQHLLAHRSHDNYAAYRSAELAYHAQLARLRSLGLALFTIGGSASVLLGIFTEYTPAMVIGLGLTGAALVVFFAEIRERGRDRAQERITETVGLTLDNHE